MSVFYFLVYKTTNLINGKIYIGKHKTTNLSDGYIGSGRLLKKAISKYGIENFRCEVIHFCSSEEESNILESHIVTEEFCKRKDTYNLCEGGKGGFSYINREGLRSTTIKTSQVAALSRLVELREDPEWSERDRQSRSERMIEYNKTRTDQRFKGQTHSEQTKRLISDIKKNTGTGRNNSQFGSFWITNGTISKKIQPNDEIPVDWHRGRIVNRNNNASVTAVNTNHE